MAGIGLKPAQVLIRPRAMRRHGRQRAGSNQAAAIDGGAAVGAEAALGAEAAVGAALAFGAEPHEKLTCRFTFKGVKYTVFANAKSCREGCS